MREYDFRRPTKLSRENIRVLQIAMEAFARGATTSLTGALRTGVRLDLVAIEQMSYDDYVAALPNPVFLGLFSLDPLVGRGALQMPLDAAMAAMDHLLGGPGTTLQPSRPMTAMETALTRSLLDRLMAELAGALAPLTPLTPEVTSFEYNPALAQVTGASETVIVGQFSLRLGSRECPVTLCLPFSSFEMALERAGAPHLTTRERAARVDAANKMAARLEDVPVEVVVRLGSQTMPAVDLAALEVGSLLTLRHQVAVPFEVTAADVTFAHATPWNHRRRMAAKIVPSPLSNSKDHR